MFGLSFLSVKLIAIGVAILAIVGYITFLHLEVKHYKDSANKWEVTYNTYKNSEEGMQAALKSSNSALTLQAKQELIARLTADNAKNAVINERIASDKAAKAIAIPADSIRLLNSSASAGRDPTRAAATQSGNDGTVEGTSGDTQVGFNFQDVEGTIAENNESAWTCIRVARAWQQFWTDFSANVGRAAIHASP